MALKIGLQMYSIRNAMSEDPVKAIRNAADIGYRYFELANLNALNDFGSGFFIPAKELRKAMDDINCQVISAHIDPFLKENVDKVLEYHVELGTKYLMSKPFEGTRKDVEAACETYRFLGEKCRAAGIQHCLHTGLAPFLDDGTWLLDVIFQNTDPCDLKFEVDSYWMMRSGFDPVDVIKKFSNRIMAVHQKDLPKNFTGEVNINKLLGRGQNLTHKNFDQFVNTTDFCEIGTGRMPVQKIINAVNEYTDAEYIILEQDFTTHTEMESIKISYNMLKNYEGVSWEEDS